MSEQDGNLRIPEMISYGPWSMSEALKGFLDEAQKNNRKLQARLAEVEASEKRLAEFVQSFLDMARIALDARPKGENITHD